jgi:hypothetical protein
MYTVIRRYTNATALFDELARRESEIREVISGVPGLLAYGLTRTADGGFSMTLCESKEGTDDSVQRAAAWIKENIAADITGVTPEVMEGEVIFRILTPAGAEAAAAPV